MLQVWQCLRFNEVVTINDGVSVAWKVCMKSLTVCACTWIPTYCVFNISLLTKSIFLNLASEISMIKFGELIKCFRCKHHSALDVAWTIARSWIVEFFFFFFPSHCMCFTVGMCLLSSSFLIWFYFISSMFFYVSSVECDFMWSSFLGLYTKFLIKILWDYKVILACTKANLWCQRIPLLVDFHFCKKKESRCPYIW